MPSWRRSFGWRRPRVLRVGLTAVEERVTPSGAAISNVVAVEADEGLATSVSAANASLALAAVPALVSRIRNF
jgi:hypothetical protein